MMDKLHSVGEMATALGVTQRTLRFYEDKGLISPQRVGITRAYSHRDRGRMIVILRGKRLGFSLREIKEYLDLYDAQHASPKQMQHLLKKVHGRIARLQEQSQALEETLNELREIERATTEALAAKTIGARQ